MSLILVFGFLFCFLILLLCFLFFDEDINIDKLMKDYEKELQINNHIITDNNQQIILLKKEVSKIKRKISKQK